MPEPVGSEIFLAPLSPGLLHPQIGRLIVRAEGRLGSVKLMNQKESLGTGDDVEKQKSILVDDTTGGFSRPRPVDTK